MFSGLRSDSMSLSRVWLGLPVVSSLMEACESQQQLHGDGLHQQHCVRCAATESQASFRYRVGSRATPGNWPD